MAHTVFKLATIAHCLGPGKRRCARHCRCRCCAGRVCPTCRCIHGPKSGACSELLLLLLLLPLRLRNHLIRRAALPARKHLERSVTTQLLDALLLMGDPMPYG